MGYIIINQGPQYCVLRHLPTNNVSFTFSIFFRAAWNADAV